MQTQAGKLTKLHLSSRIIMLLCLTCNRADLQNCRHSARIPARVCMRLPGATVITVATSCFSTLLFSEHVGNAKGPTWVAHVSSTHLRYLEAHDSPTIARHALADHDRLDRLGAPGRSSQPCDAFDVLLMHRMRGAAWCRMVQSCCNRLSLAVSSLLTLHWVF